MHLLLLLNTYIWRIFLFGAIGGVKTKSPKYETAKKKFWINSVTQYAINGHTICCQKSSFEDRGNHVLKEATSELRVRLAPLNWFTPSSKIFYWPFQGGTSFVDLLCFCSVLCLLCLCARLFIYLLCGHLLGKGWPLGSRLWCLMWVCHFPIGILGQVWYLIVSIPNLFTLTYY